MEKIFYIAEVLWTFEDGDKIEDVTSYSLFASESYREVMGEIVADFGENNIISVKITPCSDGCGCGLMVSEDLAKTLIEQDAAEIKINR